MINWLSFVLGLWTGGAISILILAMAMAAKSGDDHGIGQQDS